MVKGNNYILDKAAEMQSKGVYAFSLADMRKSFPEQSDQALALALNRAVKKGRVKSVHKGYYVIVPPEYSAQGLPPPPLFIDGLMKHLQRQYYVGLLNAAAYHGAGHQQPQEFTVVTGLPPLRMKQSRSMKIQFVAKKEIPAVGIEQRKTDTGYFNISGPELTALDLVQFEDRIGGLNRASQVLNELADNLDPLKLRQFFDQYKPSTAYVQRLGHLLENVTENDALCDSVEMYLLDQGKRLQRVPLKSKGKRSEYRVNDRWKIIENMKIDI